MEAECDVSSLDPEMDGGYTIHVVTSTHLNLAVLLIILLQS